VPYSGIVHKQKNPQTTVIQFWRILVKQCNDAIDIKSIHVYIWDVHEHQTMMASDKQSLVYAAQSKINLLFVFWFCCCVQK
jgi:hypothetical protein